VLVAQVKKKKAFDEICYKKHGISYLFMYCREKKGDFQEKVIQSI